MFALIKGAWTVFAPYRFWALAIAAAGVLTTVLVFYGNCRANAVALESANTTIKELRLDLSAARVELEARNERIRVMNKRQMDELQKARDLLDESLAVANRLRSEREDLKLQLEENRFELLEAVRDDEDMADWVDYDVPAVAWGLLQQAAQATPGRDVRADH